MKPPMVELSTLKKAAVAAADDRPVVLPFYLVCDVSQSMAGEIDAVNTMLIRMRDRLMMEPVLGDKVRFGVIDFSDDAGVVVQLSDFADVNLSRNTLSVRGGTCYAAAFRKVRETIDADVAGADARFRYFRPAVWFMTDGYPTDDSAAWEQAFSDLTAYDPATGRGNKRYPLVVPFGFGAADRTLLSRLVYPQNRSALFMAAEGTTAEAAIEAMLNAMLVSMLQSGQSATTDRPQHFIPTAADVGQGIEVYPGGDFVS